MVIQVHSLCRPGAILDLAREQVDFEHGVIEFNPKGRRRTKKRRPALRLTRSLRETLLDIESRYCAQAKPGWPEFTHYVTWRCGPVKEIDLAFQRVVERAGLQGTNVTLYSIRHTMGRELRRCRVPSEEIAMCLGHKPKNTAEATFFYAPFDPDYLRDSLVVIQAFWDRVKTRQNELLQENSVHLLPTHSQLSHQPTP